jgi:hypothetical protein
MNAFDDECDDTYSDNDDHEAQDDDNSVNNVDGYNSDGHSTITLLCYPTFAPIRWILTYSFIFSPTNCSIE